MSYFYITTDMLQINLLYAVLKETFGITFEGQIGKGKKMNFESMDAKIVEKKHKWR